MDYAEATDIMLEAWADMPYEITLDTELSEKVLQESSLKIECSEAIPDISISE